MTIPRLAALLTTATLAVACTRTVVVSTRPQPAPPAREPEEPRERERPRPATAATLGIPPGHLPRAGECRIWRPGVPPGRQRSERSSSCVGIAREAPAGSWVVYRPTRDRRLVHVRVVDRRRPGVIVVVRVFDFDSGRFLREEPYVEPRDERDDRDGPGRVSRPAPRPPADPRVTPEERPRPPEERPRPPEEQPVPLGDLPGPARPPKPDQQPSQQPPQQPPPDPRGPFGERRRPEGAPARGPVAPLDIPPGHRPRLGECRIWIPGTPPGRQPHRASGACETITRDAPAGSWVVYRPTADQKVVHVRVVDARRPGVLVFLRVFDAESGQFLREERP